MAKSLKDILQGVKSSKKVVNDLGGYKPKAGDEEDFAKEHEIEKYEDRVGNKDDVYDATNVEPALKKEKRHGYKNLKDAEKVYEARMKCEACGKMYEGDSCGCGEKKSKEAGPGKKGMLYGDKKVSVNEAWYSEKGGERTFHKGQREAMRHAREIGGKYGATHGAQGMKASKALGWDAKEKEGLGLGLTSKADKVKAAQKQKATKKAGPWGLKEASLPAIVKSNLPVAKSNLPAVIKNKPVAKTGAEAKPGMSDKMKKTIGTGAVLGTAAAGYASLPDDDDEDTKKSNAPSAGKKDDFPQAGRWRDEDDKKVTTPEREIIPTQHVPVNMPKKEPDEPVFSPKTPESYWDRRARMKGEIEDAKHEVKLKKIKAGEVNEVITKKTSAGEVISDFVHSDNPKFKGKSKEKRKQMALAAYYAKQRNEEAVSEAVTTGNEGHGYHGEAYGAATSDDKMAEAGKAYTKAHALVKQHAAEHLRDVKNPNKMVKHYLDSQYGRHLHGNEHDAGYVKKDFAHFKRKYKPEMHEEADLDEALKGKQHKIDKNKNGKIDAEDFKLLRKEDSAVPLLGGMTGKEKIGKTNLKKKVKEQTGPDTPLTLPNMSVDVNTGRNV